MLFSGVDIYTFKGRAVYFSVAVAWCLLSWSITKVVFPDPRADLRHDVPAAFRVVFCGIFLMGTAGSIIMYTLVVRNACRNNNGDFPAEMSAPVELDAKTTRPVCLLSGLTSSLWLVTNFMFGLAVGGVSMSFFMLVYGLCYYLPRKADEWCPPNGRRFLSIARRTAAVSGGVGAGPALFLPSVIDKVDPSMLIFYYPLLVSFMEFLTVSFLFSDKAVKGYSSEALSLIARTFVATFEASRIGLLVVMTNKSGDFYGLVSAIAWSVVLDILARHDLFNVGGWVIINLLLPRRMVRALVRFVEDDNSDTGSNKNIVGHVDNKQLPEASAISSAEKVVSGEGKSDIQEGRATAAVFLLPRMERFKCVYLGSKVEVEYWGPLLLAFMQVMNWGYPTVNMGVDEETGELPALLRADWDVIAAFLAGEIICDMISAGVGSSILRWAPHFAVDAPTLQPGRDIVIHVSMWSIVSTLYMVGICSMGQLDVLLNKETGGEEEE